MRTIVYILVFFLFGGCSKTTVDFERTSLIFGRQKIEVLTAHELFENFITAKGDYSKDVFTPIKNEFIENAEYPFILESIEGAINPDQKLKAFHEKLKALDFKQLIAPELQKIVGELPGPDTKILFIPANPAYVDFFMQNQIAVTAITVGAGKIIVSINPESDFWEDQLPYVLAHEYHHSVWTARNFTTKDFTPLEYLIFEGRADSFAKMLYPDINNPWTHMIDARTEKKVWNIIKPELFKRETEMNDLMMVGNEEIPYCSGYTIGFNIVQKFKKNNPDISDRIIIDLDPAHILELSLYEE